MMSNDDLERKMYFIVEQQAQFASDIQQLREAQELTSQTVAQTANEGTRVCRNTRAQLGNRCRLLGFPIPMEKCYASTRAHFDRFCRITV